MGYRIEYGPMPKLAVRKKHGSLRLHILTTVCLLLFVLTVRQTWPEGTELLRRILLPGEPTVTEQAANELIAGLQSGASFEDAVTVFCRQILEYGQAG